EARLAAGALRSPRPRPLGVGGGRAVHAGSARGRRRGRAQALGLGRVLVLGISWGGFLGPMYAARHPASVRALAVVGAAASRDFMRRAEDNAKSVRHDPAALLLRRAPGDGRPDAALRDPLSARRPRAQRSLAARGGAGDVRPRARGYFPVQRTALSDW